MKLRRPAIELLLASLTVLFQELTLIRWLPTRVRVVAYFPNLILLAAFLGIGIGCLRSRGKDLRLLWPAALLVLVGSALLLSRVAFTAESASEHLWLLYFDLPPGAPVVQGVRLPILACFLLCAASFIPLGQLVATRLEAFRAEGFALTGYGWDLFGSMLGCVLFTTACFLRSFPIWWFGALAIFGAIFFIEKKAALGIYAALMAAILCVVGFSEKAQLYSPYYAISTKEDWTVTVNGSLHQQMLDVGPVEEANDTIGLVREGYHVPYRELHRKPRHVLVLGAGTGNDVAVALAEGAESVDAVEIDPVILDVGKRLHPDHPYDSPRVHIHNTDARSFLNTTQDKFDLIVFGTLDSMTRLSALSSVRLDNYVYTLESLRAARRLLTPDGGVALYFLVNAQHLHLRLLQMVAVAFEDLPRLASENRKMFNSIYMAGPAFTLRGDARAAAADALQRLEPLELATDDWPYLYLRARGITPFYWSLIGLLFAISAAAILLASRELRGSLRAFRNVDVEMFLLGAGFLLLETASVTEMTLVWGVTWLTNAIVFASILLTALVGTLLQKRSAWPWQVGVIGISISLLIGYAVPTAALATSSLLMRMGLSVLFIGAPILFAATLFASIFAARKEADLAFGWNLLGAVAGGLLEFLSMQVGIKALHLLALVLYLALGLLRARSQKTADALPASTL